VSIFGIDAANERLIFLFLRVSKKSNLTKSDNKQTIIYFLLIPLSSASCMKSAR
jgi:hypothetical protein